MSATPRRVLSTLQVIVLAGVAHGQASDSGTAARFQSIPWVTGPATGALGVEAHVIVPPGCRFAGADGMKTFMELTQNPPTGHEQGVLLCRDAADTESIWFVLFSFDPSGYVKDDEGDKLDSNAILESLRSSTAAANEERRTHGWSPLTVDGWVQSPYYDRTTHNLTWGTLLTSGDTTKTVNHSVRLLGRTGVMHADLVLNPTQLTGALPAFASIIASYRFENGRTYAEWRAGDKVAAYGLTALIAGGAGAAAVKSGLLARGWKAIIALLAAAWKFVAAAVAGFLAWVRSLFKRKPKSGPQGSAPPTRGT